MRNHNHENDQSSNQVKSLSFHLKHQYTHDFIIQFVKNDHFRQEEELDQVDRVVLPER